MLNVESVKKIVIANAPFLKDWFFMYEAALKRLDHACNIRWLDQEDEYIEGLVDGLSAVGLVSNTEITLIRELETEHYAACVEKLNI